MKKVFAILLCVLPLFAAEKVIELHQSPSCGCCGFWAQYMQKKGYTLNIHKDSDLAKIKAQNKIKPELQSCHTGLIEGYAIEGHVPESAISWLLENKPKGVIGISAPGMPQGSPGMEQGIFEEYPVVLMLEDGSHQIYGYFKGDKLIRKN